MKDLAKTGSGMSRARAETRGLGVFYYKNPRDLFDRLELLGGSIIAGNNSAKNEFSEVAHTLHKLGAFPSEVFEFSLDKISCNLDLWYDKTFLLKRKRTIERPIQISSINRETSGISRPEDFIIRFTPPLQISEDMYHEIALNRVNMTYSWYNMRNDYNNNTIKYSPDMMI